MGGFITLQLLERGQPPESIRIVDFTRPTREDLLSGPAVQVGFVHADITSSASLNAAFAQPWPSPVSGRPLTVFHVAAVIRFAERSRLFYDRVSGVNVAGTANAIAAARSAGADIFIATSSGSVGMRRVSFWTWPWARHPARYVQFYDESDFDRPPRPHDDYFANYAVSKAEAERLVCGANDETFRTGVIRPGSTVYGHKQDQFVGRLIQEGEFVTFATHVIQSLVSGRNVSLAHLQFEAALLPGRKPVPRCAGRPFLISDPGPAPAFGDFFFAAQEMCVTTFRAQLLPPAALLLVAHLIEEWCLLLARFPLLTRLGLAEPRGAISNLQPSVFSASVHMLAVDAAARRSVAGGGLGYTGVEDSLEGVCQQIIDWNREQERKGLAANKMNSAGTVHGSGGFDSVIKKIVPAEVV